jgi:hypothetical protein
MFVGLYSLLFGFSVWQSDLGQLMDMLPYYLLGGFILTIVAVPILYWKAPHKGSERTTSNRSAVGAMSFVTFSVGSLIGSVAYQWISGVAVVGNISIFIGAVITMTGALMPDWDIPFLGICLGLQCAVIEYARSVCGLKAGSSEFDPDVEAPVIDLMLQQRNLKKMGGNMRLGSYPCRLKEGSLAERLYGIEEIDERHRHRWEVNNEYREILKENGLVFSGLSPEGDLVEMVELDSHPYFIASQFHPEFKSRPQKPHPLFDGLVKAAIQLSNASREQDFQETSRK